MRYYITVFVSVLCVISISACKTSQVETLDLDQAKKIAAKFENVTEERSFKKKDAEEILKKLKSSKIDPEIELAIQKSLSISANTAVEYYERGMALKALGLQEEADTDLGKAADLDPQPAYLFAAAISKLRKGFPQTGANLLERVIKETEKAGLQGWKMPAHLWLSMIDSQLGRFESAERRILEMKSIYADSANWRGDAPRDLYQAHIATAESRLASERGEAEKALEFAKEAIIFAEKDLGKYKKGTTKYVDRLTGISKRNLQTAVMLKKSGRMREAEIASYKAIQFELENFGNSSSNIAESLAMISQVLSETNRTEQSLEIAKYANKIIKDFNLPDTSITTAKVRSQLAKSYLLMGEYNESYKIYGELYDAFYNLEFLKEFTFGRDLSFGIAAFYGGDRERARSYFTDQLMDRRSKLGDKNYKTAIVALASEVVSRSIDNEHNFVSSIRRYAPILYSRSRRSEGESDAISALEKEFVFNGVLKQISELGTDSFGPNSENRDLAEISLVIGSELTSGAVQKALSSSNARMGLKDQKLSELIRSEQDALRRIGALNSLLADNLSRPKSEQSPEGISAIEKDIAEYRIARAKFREAIEKSYPEYAELIDPTVSRVIEAFDVVGPNELVIQTYVGPDNSYVWSINQGKKIVFHSVSVDRNMLGKVVKQLRSALDPKVATIGEIPDYDMRLAYFLYDRYLKRVIGREATLEKISVVQHGHLGMLPIGALITSPFELGEDSDGLFSRYKEAPFLIKKYAVAQLPSVSALSSLRRVEPGSDLRKAFLGIGDPVFSRETALEGSLEGSQNGTAGQVAMRGLPLKRRSAPSDIGRDSLSITDLPQLPDTTEEVVSIAMVLKANLDEDVFLGERATERNIKDLDLSNRKVIMFATHGLVPGELDGLEQPALALSNPAYGLDQNDDGLLTVDEVLNLSLNADWVVLSACNTGAGDGDGAEAISGLGRAFFYAGTRALLVTNWPVETTSARLLTTSLFEKVTSLNMERSTALRAAMLDLISGPGALDVSGKKSLFRYAHPIFWAPFSLIGD
jgi:CHAT domain-containing protein/tetratricopeptide (TPR) repeat protein